MHATAENRAGQRKLKLEHGKTKRDKQV